MAVPQTYIERTRGVMMTQRVARAMVVLWASFWTFFAVASSGGSAGFFSHWIPITFTVLLWVTVLFTWRQTRTSGLLVVGESLAIAAWYFTSLAPRSPANWIIFVAGSLIAPPLVAGLLILAGSLGRRQDTA